MSKYKPGDEVTYEIGGKKLILTAMKWGRLKKAMKLITENMAILSDPEVSSKPVKIMAWASSLIETHSDIVFPLLLDIKLNPFMTSEWVDENLSLTDIRKIVLDAIEVNGVGDFFGQKGNLKTESPISDSASESQANKQQEPVAS